MKLTYKHSQYNVVVKKNKDTILLFNSFSGSLIELGYDEYERFCNNNFSDKDFLNALINQGFLVDSNINEYNRTLYHEKNLIYRDNSRLFLVVAPTLNCNMRCVYCFEGDKHNATMTLETEKDLVKFIVKNLEEMPNVKELKISWFGGEPILCLSTIKRISKNILKYCTTKSIKYSAIVVSNGLLITRQVAKQLVECKVNKIQITLDGTCESYCRLKGVNRHVYDAVLANINEICDLLQVIIRLNCTNNNKQDIASLIEELSKNDKITLYLAPIENYNNVLSGDENNSIKAEDFLKLKKQMLKRFSKSNLVNRMEVSLTPLGLSCSLLKVRNCIIGPLGELYNCEHDIGNPTKIIGNLRSGLYYNGYYMNVLTPQHLVKCQTCDIFPICLSGCQSEVRNFGRTVKYCKNKKDSLKQYLTDYYLKKED